MTKVYVWLPGSGSPYGHCSLQTSKEYLSWWPEEEMIDGEPMFVRSYERDCKLMGGPKKGKKSNRSDKKPRSANREISINGLVEKDIDKFIKRKINNNKGKYHLINSNCASMVANCLQEGLPNIYKEMDEWERIKLFGRFVNPLKWKEIYLGLLAIGRGDEFFWTPSALTHS